MKENKWDKFEKIYKIIYWFWIYLYSFSFFSLIFFFILFSLYFFHKFSENQI